LRKPRRLQADRRGAARMQRLAHGAEHALQPRGLRGRNAERMRGGRSIQPQHVAHGSSRADCADRRGGVPAALVVRAADQPADAAFGLEARGERFHEPLAVELAMLGQRQHGRGDRHGRMAAEVEIHIVEVERVRHRPVQQRCLLDVDAAAAADHGRLRRAAVFGDLLGKNIGQRLIARGERHPEEIHEAVAGDRARFDRKVVVAQVGCLFRERCGDQHRLGRIGLFASACGGSHGVLRSLLALGSKITGGRQAAEVDLQQ
jgi:hypothetical protein